MLAEPLILVTNDDGISAPGLQALVQEMEKIGEVYVVAPQSPQSAMGHAITINNILSYDMVSLQNRKNHNYSISGTPADCVKLAIRKLLPRKPDLCVSGINHGANCSVNALYSGTMSAAVESGIEGIKSIAFSLMDYEWNADFSEAKEFVYKITKHFLESKENGILNVNIPKKTENKIKGIKVCRQSNGNWIEEFVERKNPNGKSYFWLSGNFANLEPDAKDTDLYALNNNYVSVVPCKIDKTDYELLNKLSFEK